MAHPRILAAFLLLLAVALYLTPASLLTSWRLAAYGFYQTMTERVEKKVETPVDLSDQIPLRLRIRELRDRLLVQDAEISRLKKILRDAAAMHSSYPALKFQVSRIITAGGTLAEGAVLIKAGLDDGIVNGAAILQGGVLAGQVALAGKKASQVLLLTAPGSVVAARAGISRESCSVHGDGQGMAHVVFYVPQVKAERDEPILTSGLLGKIPADIIIGTLKETPREGEEPGTMEAALQLQADFATLEDVLVVTNVKPDASVPSTSVDATSTIGR